MAYNFSQMIPWPLLKNHIEQQQKAVDAKLRRAVEPDAAMLRGRAQLFEELLNLPETLQVLVDQDAEDKK
jgi:hypothetical protein